MRDRASMPCVTPEGLPIVATFGLLECFPARSTFFTSTAFTLQIRTVLPGRLLGGGLTLKRHMLTYAVVCPSSKNLRPIVPALKLLNAPCSSLYIRGCVLPMSTAF